MGNTPASHVKHVLTIFAVFLILISMLMSNVCVSFPSVKESSKIIFVPDDFDMIQKAVKAANDGDTIIVRDGIYFENIDVFKSVKIISENGPNSTIIIADMPSDDVFDILSNNVTLSGFTIKGSSNAAGIFLHSLTSSCNISNNIIVDNFCGIRLDTALKNNISSNLIANNTYGITLDSSSRENTISENIIKRNVHGIYLSDSFNNKIYLNCFMNENNVYSSDSTNIWSTPEEVSYLYENRNLTSFLGNFWSDYYGEDLDNNGIGDYPYKIGSMDADEYPLMGLFKNNVIPLVDIFPPVIEFVNVSSIHPKPNEDIKIVAYVIDRGSGVNRTILWYSINYETWIPLEMVKNNSYWTAIIPGKPEGTTIEFYIEAFDNQGNRGESEIYYLTVRATYYLPSNQSGGIFAAAFALIVLLLLMFLAIVGYISSREEEPTILPSRPVVNQRTEDEYSLPEEQAANLKKDLLSELPKLSEEEKDILFELESEKSALEDLLKDLDEKYKLQKINAKEYYELYKKYKRELYLVEKKLREFKVKLGLRGTLRCMVCGLEIKSGEDIVFCRYCNSPAHREHLLEWLHIKRICPYCRHPLRETDLL
ncbi:MAG: NosD domain-containing protein [Candidatus Baldrarchaeota archaeon]|nr:NosD domain-containing protein [Candidatus Baldrarchaeota archaeon]